MKYNILRTCMRQHVAIPILGTPTSPSAGLRRKRADEDVSDPRVGCKLFFRDKPRTEG